MARGEVRDDRLTWVATGTVGTDWKYYRLPWTSTAQLAQNTGGGVLEVAWGYSPQDAPPDHLPASAAYITASDARPRVYYGRLMNRVAVRSLTSTSYVLEAWVVLEDVLATNLSASGGLPTNLSFGDLLDVDTTGAASGNTIVYNGAGLWIPGTYAETLYLRDLADVETAGVASGQALTYNGTSWVPVDGLYLPLAGGTMVGDIVMSADGTATASATTYDSQRMLYQSSGWNSAESAADLHQWTEYSAASSGAGTTSKVSWAHDRGYGDMEIAYLDSEGNFVVNYTTPTSALWVIAAADTYQAGYSTDGINWTGASSSILSKGYCVAYDGSMWILGGDPLGYSGPNFIYSYDGINWSPGASGIFDDYVNALAWNGSMWVAVGGTTNSIATSPDGMTWTPVASSPFGETTYGNGVAWNGSMWVAVGLPGSVSDFPIAYSYDGITWTGVGSSIFTSEGVGVAWGGDRWVAVGHGTNTIAYSYDGISWTGLGQDIFPPAGLGRCVAWNGSMWVAGGQTDLAYSYDGISWTSITPPYSFNVTSVAWNGNMWAACGNDGDYVSYSYDGINWTLGATGSGLAYGAGVASFPAPHLVPPLTSGASSWGLVKSGRYESTVTTGTSPMTIQSTTLVTNLNADLLDGQHAADFVTTAAITGYVPYTGATANLELGQYQFSSLVQDMYQGTAGFLNYNYMRMCLLSGEGVVTANVSVSYNSIGMYDVDSNLLFSVDSNGAVSSVSSISGETLESTVAQGTSPLTVTSSSAVSNLNADLLDGYHFSDVATAIGSGYLPLTGGTLTGPLTVAGSSPLITMGASSLSVTASGLVLPVTKGYGTKVASAGDTFPWHDMLGKIHARGTGPTDPSWATYRAPIKQYQFTVDDEVWVEYHVVHDYLPGSDLYLHAHWSHIATTVTGGSVTWGFSVSYAKGHNQGAFSAPVSGTVQQNASTTQYQHLIGEYQLSAATPSANQLDSDDIEVDGLILVRVWLVSNDITVSGGGVPEPFLHFADIHYQSTGVGTYGKAPPFWGS